MARDGSKKIRPAPDELVPLLSAAAVALQEVYRGTAGIERKAAVDVMAHALCDLSPVHVRDGGRLRTLHSGDPRPSLAHISIRAGDLRKVIQILIDSGVALSDLRRR